MLDVRATPTLETAPAFAKRVPTQTFRSIPIVARICLEHVHPNPSFCLRVSIWTCAFLASARLRLCQNFQVQQTSDNQVRASACTVNSSFW